MPSIAYIVSVLPTRSETFVYREIRELRARGWKVTCVSLNPPPTPEPTGLEDLAGDRIVVYRGIFGFLGRKILDELFHPVRGLRTALACWRDVLSPGERLSLTCRLKLFWQAFAGQALASELRRRGVSHIHCHFAHAPTTVGMYAAIQLGCTFSFTGHANDLFQRRALLSRKLERAVFVCSISDWHRDFYEKAAPGTSEKAPVIRCGVDVTSWNPRATAPGSTAGADGPLKVLTVARLVEKKGIDRLIEALALTPPPWNLVVAGDGPQRAELEALVDRLQVRPHVTFLGAVDNDRVRTLLEQADAFALPCRDDKAGDRDGIPVVLMEAMACGLPVVSGDLPAIRELVADRQSGLLVDGNDARAVAAAIATLRDPHIRAQLGGAGRARVEEEFSLAANVSRLELQLRRAIQRTAANTDALPEEPKTVQLEQRT